MELNWISEHHIKHLQHLNIYSNFSGVSVSVCVCGTSGSIAQLTGIGYKECVGVLFRFVY